MQTPHPHAMAWEATWTPFPRGTYQEILLRLRGQENAGRISSSEICYGPVRDGMANRISLRGRGKTWNHEREFAHDRTTKSYRPGFDALEDRALMTAGLLGSPLVGMSKPLMTEVQTSPAHETNTQSTQPEDGIIAILIGL